MVTVDGADVLKAHLLKDRARLFWSEVVRDAVADAGGKARHGRRQLLDHVLGTLSSILKPWAGAKAREIRGQRADVRRDRHPVVIEDNGEVAAKLSGMVQSFPAHAAADRGVAGDGNDVLLVAALVASGSEA